VVINLLQALRMENQHVVGVDHLEENIVVVEKEGRNTLNYVINPMKVYFGILTILQKVLTNNWQLKCGVLLETLILLGLTLLVISFKQCDLLHNLFIILPYLQYK